MGKKKVIAALFATMMSVSMAVPVAAATSPKNGGAITAKAGAGINVVDTIRLDNNGRARYEGTLSGEDVRYYKFTPTKTGILKVTTSGSEDRIEETIREEFSNKLLINTYNNHQDSYTLAKGTTYLIGVENAFSFYDNNNYTVSFEYKEAKETFPEDYFNENENGEIDQARSLELNKTYYGARTITEEAEWYKFTLNKDSKVFIALSDNAYGSIYNSNKQQEVIDYGMYGWCTQEQLKKGTYYINIRILPGKVGQYSICINDRTKSSTTKVTKPKATYITKLSKGSKRFKVSVKKQSATGYQVQYSRKSNFKGSKTKTFKGTSYTVKGLKGKKKYYVRVRSYKKSGSKTLYSAWSKKKSVKTKK